MANIGTVKSVTGVVKAIAANGSERILSAGDSIAENETIITGDGLIVAELANGKEMDLGRNSSLVIDQDILGQDDEQPTQDPQSAEDEVAALQQALADNPNLDPSALPATAAGAGAAGAENNGHSFISVDYLNPKMDPFSGFETAGRNPEFPSSEIDPGELLLAQEVNGLPSAGSVVASVDDEGLKGGIEGGTGDLVVPNTDGDNNESTFSGQLIYSFGPDGAGNVSFASLHGTPVQASGDNGLQNLTSGGDPITFVWAAGSHTLTGVANEGSQGGYDVFTLQITDISTGDYTFTLLQAVDHPTADTEDDLVLNLPFTVTDSNGDEAVGSIVVTIDDDVPEVVVEATVNGAVDEANLDTVLSSGTNEDGAEDGPAVTATGSLAGLFTSGADEDLVISFDDADLSGLTAQGLTSNGDALVYTIVGDVLTAKATDSDSVERTVFTLELAHEDAAAVPPTAEGDYTFTLFDQLDHAAPVDPDVSDTNTLDIDFSSVIVATDADDDQVGLTDQFTITVTDDVPTANDESPHTGVETHITELDFLGNSVSIGQAEGFKSVTGVSSIKNGDTLKIDWTGDNQGDVNWVLRDGNNVVASGTAKANTDGVVAVLTGLEGIDNYDLYIDYAATGNKTITVNDVRVDSLSTTSFTGDVTTNDSFGADGAVVAAITYTNADGILTENATVSEGSTFETQYGTLSIDPDGSYNYVVKLNAVPDNNLDHQVTDNIEYTLLDGDGDTDAANMSFEINDIQAPSVLDVVMLTNTNNQVQPVILTFVDQNSPKQAYSRLFALGAQGQEGTFTPDTGFDINASNPYIVALEAATSTTKVNLTDFSIEGVAIFGQATGNGGGVKGLILDNDSAINSDQTAFTAVITPNAPPPTQVLTDSVDGDATANTFTDTTPMIVNYYYGADDNDKLTGSSGSDVLNGGGGVDELKGDGGNDILVYDPLDSVIDGGAGDDVLRIDQGALELFFNNNGAGNEQHSTVDLSGITAITNMEVLLLTDVRGSDPAKGTTLTLNAQDVLDFTDDRNTLHVLGSVGDQLDIDLATGTGNPMDGEWVYVGTTADNFLQYTSSVSGVTATLLVENGGQIEVM